MGNEGSSGSNNYSSSSSYGGGTLGYSDEAKKACTDDCNKNNPNNPNYDPNYKSNSEYSRKEISDANRENHGSTKSGDRESKGIYPYR
jgi:hypothetical protein